jgi:Uma2 family endonuclease
LIGKSYIETATARRPDIIVLDETQILNEPYWEKEPVITLGRSIKLVVEVVSTNWETDYARKVEEYALLGIPEYWIVDYRGLGGIAFIGKPKQPTFTVCQLNGEEYSQQQYRLGQTITSHLLPNFQMCLDEILPR